MLKFIKNKVLKSQLHPSPYPYMFIRNFIKKKDLKKINSILPSYKNLYGNDIMYQSKSKTKKTILPSSKFYKKLNKDKKFVKFNVALKKIMPDVLKKFDKHIKLHVNKEYINSKLIYHSSYSVMTNGYIKSPHTDRRDHLITIIFYADSDCKKGGDILINKIINHKKNYDIFPDKKNILIKKRYKIPGNSCLIILNVPWAYHSVSKYFGNKDRKYFYCVYDFPIKKSGSAIENRKKGFNKNNFWKKRVELLSNERKNNFLSE
jgi:hypothetical protein